MNAPVTRRALLGATAAVGAVGLPAAATTLANPMAAANADADLFVLLDRWHEARAAWDATDVPLDEAQTRAKAAYRPCRARCGREAETSASTWMPLRRVAV